MFVGELSLGKGRTVGVAGLKEVKLNKKKYNCTALSIVCAVAVASFTVLPVNPCQVGPLSPQHRASLGWRDGLQLWRVAANTLNKQPQTIDKGWLSSLAGWAWG
jgi:hypothetical protein